MSIPTTFEAYIIKKIEEKEKEVRVKDKLISHLTEQVEIATRREKMMKRDIASIAKLFEIGRTDEGDGKIFFKGSLLYEKYDKESYNEFVRVFRLKEGE